MAKRTMSSTAVCPFYRYDNGGQIIECEGPVRGCCVSLSFRSRRKCDEWKAIYCNGSYNVCPWARAMAEEYKRRG